MIVKIKKLYKKRIVKFIAGGEIKEVLVNEDLFHPEKKRILICFRGHRDSGIIDLSSKEASELYNTLKSQLGIVKEVKVIRERR